MFGQEKGSGTRYGHNQARQPQAMRRVLQCNRPLASACAGAKGSLEDADAHFFDPHCPCGWTVAVIGIEAVKHRVQPWGFIDATATREQIVGLMFDKETFRYRKGRRRAIG
jgi:hypothetical protein